MGKQVWQSEDGAIFETAVEMEVHEITLSERAMVDEYLDSLEPLPRGQRTRMERAIRGYNEFLDKVPTSGQGWMDHLDGDDDQVAPIAALHGIPEEAGS